MKDEATGRLPANVTELLARQGKTKHYLAGDLLIQEGEHSDSLYVLRTGQLTVFTRGSKGREVVFSGLEPGEIFGELFLDGEPRSASVKATVAAECLVIPGDGVRKLIKAEPDFADFLIMRLIARLRNATRKIKSIALDGVYERTVSLLEEVAIPEGAKWRIPRSMTQGEIASRIGATREMVNHVLRDMTRGGFIEKGGPRDLTIVKKLPRRW